jgi:hypothetical protein
MKQVKIWNRLYDDNKLDYNKYILSFNSWLGHIKHANSYNLKEKVMKKIKFIEEIY